MKIVNRKKENVKIYLANLKDFLEGDELQQNINSS